MSAPAPHWLIFHAGAFTFGVAADRVEAILPLPELEPAVEVSGAAGVFEWRGGLVPVRDLRAEGRGDYRLSDSVVVAGTASGPLGLLATEVESIVQGHLLPPLQGTAEAQPAVLGHLRVGDAIALLLDPDRLWRLQLSVEGRESAGEFWPGAGPEQHAVLRQRAARLRAPRQVIAAVERSLAVVRLGRELFAFDLAEVAGFAEFSVPVPVPGCPEFVLGNMNLRGRIVTLIDFRAALGLPVGGLEAGGKVVLVSDDGLLAGFPVDEVWQVVPLSAGGLQPLAGRQAGFVKGAVEVEGRPATLLSVPLLLASGRLTVDQSPHMTGEQG